MSTNPWPLFIPTTQSFSLPSYIMAPESPSPPSSIISSSSSSIISTSSSSSPSYFPPFLNFPPEIQHAIWEFTIRLTPPTPEVCIAWPLIMQDGGETGPGEPHLPMTVDTAWPVIAHVCHQSRAFFLRGVQHGRLPVTMRFSPQAAMQVPYRLFQPEIDTLYWTVETHSWLEGSFFDPTRSNDFPQARYIRHVAMEIVQGVRAEVEHTLLSIKSVAPDFETMTLVLPGAVRAPRWYSQDGLRFAPPARRCRLRTVPNKVVKRMLVCQYRPHRSEEGRMRLRGPDGRPARRRWWRMDELMKNWIWRVNDFADEVHRARPEVQYKMAVFEEWKFAPVSELRRYMPLGMPARNPGDTEEDEEERQGRWVEVCEDRHVAMEGLEARVGYIPPLDRQDPTVFRVLDYDCGRFDEFTQERRRRKAEQENPEDILASSRVGWLFGEEEMV